VRTARHAIRAASRLGSAAGARYSALPSCAILTVYSICPGRHLAEAALFASLASALALLDIMPARDEYGMPLIPPVDVSSGLLSYPRPFAYALLPRDGAEKLLRETGHA
jgi:hypothetical protein